MSAILIRADVPRRSALFLSLFAVVLFLAVGTSASIPSQNPDASTDPIVGSYCGGVLEACNGPSGYEGMSEDAVSTTVVRSATGELTGQYLVQTKYDSYVGHLRQHGPVENQAVNFDWRDKYGTGTINMQFDKSFTNFTGHWTSSNGLAVNEPWTGTKTAVLVNHY